MTDLHCHILPGMDDGAKDTAVSLELLRREYEDGVRNIAFTSHFNSERTTVDAFTAKRQRPPPTTPCPSWKPACRCCWSWTKA